mmetsp:Transcript_34129/g.52380  ORF Transcript_34129/g.52380 Transcript_34129/m.52380 type:complete len:196 (+) Transcript_34129:1061-1648(+)
MHSGTKYLGGHSDVLLGLVVCSTLTESGQHIGPRMHTVQAAMGSVPSPLECWLTLRGMRSLHLRVERQCNNAMELAEFLNNHQHVTKVHYPGLENVYPHYDVAKKQMSAFGGMMSIEVESEAMAMAVAGGVGTIRRATSLGGTETLIEHRASIEPPERRYSPPGLLRISLGLEDINDLKDDLNTALEIASEVVSE